MNSFCRISLIVITLFHIISIFAKINQHILDISAISLLVFGLPLQKKGFRKITLIFLFLGSLILLFYKMPYSIWLKSVSSMTNIIAITIVMQLFTIPISIGKYSLTVEYWLKRLFKKESSLYFFAMLVTNLFSSFLLFGTIPVMVSLFTKALSHSVSDHKYFLSTAILRGYSLVLFWTPGAIVMLLVMQVTNVSWSSLFVPGIILSLIGMITAYGYEHIMHLNKPLISNIGGSAAMVRPNAGVQSLHILAVVVGLLILVSLFDYAEVGSSGIGRVLLAGLITSVLWIAAYSKRKILKYYIGDYFKNGIADSTDFSVFFIAIGFFAGAVDSSGILTLLQPVLQIGVNHLGFMSVIIIPAVFIALSMVGLHPLVLTVLLGKILLSVDLPLTVVGVALMIILSASISLIVSPFAGMTLMTSKMLNAEPVDVAFKWNFWFCVIFLIEGIIFAFLWH